MQQRKIKAKPQPKATIFQTSNCRFCSTFNEHSVNQLQIQQMKKKYLWTDVNSAFSCRLESFIFSNTYIFEGGYNQFKKLYQQFEVLSQYYTLNDTRELITKVIRNHVQLDVYRPVHFQGNLFTIFKNSNNTQNGIKKKNSNKGSDDFKNRSTEVDDIKSKASKKTNNFILKKNILNVDVSLLQIKKLVKNVNKMCDTFPKKRLFQTLNKQFQKTLTKSREKDEWKIECLEKQIHESLSSIKENESFRFKRMRMINEDKCPLKKSLTKLTINSKSKKKGHKRMSSDHESQKVKNYIQPLTPILYSPPRQYFGVDDLTQKKNKFPYYDKTRCETKRSRKCQRGNTKSKEKSGKKINSNIRSVKVIGK